MVMIEFILFIFFDFMSYNSEPFTDCCRLQQTENTVPYYILTPN